MKTEKINIEIYQWTTLSLVTTPVRWVVGWTYFSAFWRRIILENKLDPDAAGYVGEKFNHFMPNAFIIKPMIESLITSPDLLQVFLWIFTIIEAVVGLFVMIGLFTRLMGLGVLLLATGILLGAGWLGTTCLDEWQIGVLGMVSGMVIMFAGSGPWSIDNFLIQKNVKLTQLPLFHLLGSGSLNLNKPYLLKNLVIGSSVIVLLLTLLTNQVFHGGLWGSLHNLSVKPHLVIENPKLENSNLTFSVYRDQGADVYGSFVIAIRVKNDANKEVVNFNQKELSSIGNDRINNFYIAKIKSGKNSLVIPLGAKAEVILPIQQPLPKGNYILEIEDISGLKWSSKLII
jgi:thiosulfate dehydrogenase [quinone] large subunit